MITFSADWVQVLSLLVGTLLPLLVAVVTKSTTTPATKGILLAALSVVTNILTQIEASIAHHVPYNLGTALILGVGTFVVAVASQLGLWAPTKLSLFLQKKVGRVALEDKIEARHLAK